MCVYALRLFLQPTAHTSVVIIRTTMLKVNKSFFFIFPPYAVFAGVKIFFRYITNLAENYPSGSILYR